MERSARHIASGGVVDGQVAGVVGGAYAAHYR